MLIQKTLTDKQNFAQLLSHYFQIEITEHDFEVLEQPKKVFLEEDQTIDPDLVEPYWTTTDENHRAEIGKDVFEANEHQKVNTKIKVKFREGFPIQTNEIFYHRLDLGKLWSLRYPKPLSSLKEQLTGGYLNKSSGIKAYIDQLLDHPSIESYQLHRTFDDKHFLFIQPKNDLTYTDIPLVVWIDEDINYTKHGYVGRFGGKQVEISEHFCTLVSTNDLQTAPPPQPPIIPHQNNWVFDIEEIREPSPYHSHYSDKDEVVYDTADYPIKEIVFKVKKQNTPSTNSTRTVLFLEGQGDPDTDILINPITGQMTFGDLRIVFPDFDNPYALHDLHASIIYTHDDAIEDTQTQWKDPSTQTIYQGDDHIKEKFVIVRLPDGDVKKKIYYRPQDAHPTAEPQPLLDTTNGEVTWETTNTIVLIPS